MFLSVYFEKENQLIFKLHRKTYPIKSIEKMKEVKGGHLEKKVYWSLKVIYKE